MRSGYHLVPSNTALNILQALLQGIKLLDHAIPAELAVPLQEEIARHRRWASCWPPIWCNYCSRSCWPPNNASRFRWHHQVDKRALGKQTTSSIRKKRPLEPRLSWKHCMKKYIYLSLVPLQHEQKWYRIYSTIYPEVGIETQQISNDNVSQLVQNGVLTY